MRKLAASVDRSIDLLLIATACIRHIRQPTVTFSLKIPGRSAHRRIVAKTRSVFANETAIILIREASARIMQQGTT